MENQWFTDLVLNNPDGLSVNDATILYTCGPVHPKWYDWERELTPTMSDKAKAAGSVGMPIGRTHKLYPI